MVRAPRVGEQLPQTGLGSVNQMEAQRERPRKEHAGVRHQFRSVAEHARVLEHRVHLRRLRATDVVRDEQIVDREPPTEDVPPYEERQLPSEIDCTTRRIHCVDLPTVEPHAKAVQ